MVGDAVGGGELDAQGAFCAFVAGAFCAFVAGALRAGCGGDFDGAGGFHLRGLLWGFTPP